MSDSLASRLRDELSRMLAPLGNASTPTGVAQLLAALGRTGAEPAVATELQRLSRIASDIAALDDAALSSWSGLAQLLAASREVMSALRGLERVVSDPRATERLRGLGRELTELLFSLYLRTEHPRLLWAGDLLTLVDPAERAVPVPVVTAGTVRLPWQRDVLRAERIAGFFDDLLGTLETRYLPGGLAHAADSHQAAAELFEVVSELAWALGLASATGLFDPAAPPIPPLPPSDETDVSETQPTSRPLTTRNRRHHSHRPICRRSIAATFRGLPLPCPEFRPTAVRRPRPG